MTAVMITAARVALGMKAQNGIRKARQTITSRPVYTPPKAVLTPLELFTAVLIMGVLRLIVLAMDEGLIVG